MPNNKHTSVSIQQKPKLYTRVYHWSSILDCQTVPYLNPNTMTACKVVLETLSVLLWQG